MVNKWEIYFCNLDPTQGSEQRGTRPVLIISTDSVNHNLTVSTVLPLSSIKGNEKIYPTEILLPTYYDFRKYLLQWCSKYAPYHTTD